MSSPRRSVALGDITLRAIDVLRSADVLAAEDTRVLRRLMGIHEIPLRGRKPIAYNDHSSDSRRAKILDHLRVGKSVALVSDAGTPLLGDPGYPLGSGCDQGLRVRDSGARTVRIVGRARRVPGCRRTGSCSSGSCPGRRRSAGGNSKTCGRSQLRWCFSKRRADSARA